ncbi:MAG: hypothetical protein Q7T25_11230 [Sideroxyarcus sp.]|nr:hypothetical protein [Sideroxyarcus sp.]
MSKADAALTVTSCGSATCDMVQTYSRDHLLYVRRRTVAAQNIAATRSGYRHAQVEQVPQQW